MLVVLAVTVAVVVVSASSAEVGVISDCRRFAGLLQTANLLLLAKRRPRLQMATELNDLPSS